MSSDSDESAKRRQRRRGREFSVTAQDDWPTVGPAPSVPVVKGAWTKGSASTWGAPKKEVVKTEVVPEKPPAEGELVPLPCATIWKRPVKKVTTVKEEEVPPVKEEEVPPVKEEEVPPVKEEEVPPVKEEEVPPVKEEVTAVKEEEVATVKKEEVTTPGAPELMLTPETAKLPETMAEKSQPEKVQQDTKPSLSAIEEKPVTALAVQATASKMSLGSNPTTSSTSSATWSKPANPAPSVGTWDWGGGSSYITSKSTVSAPTGRNKSPPSSVGFSSRQTFGGRGGGLRSGQKKGMTDRTERPNPEFICNQLDSCDVVKSRPTTEAGTGQTKKGTQGKSINLTTNYYPLESMTNFNLFQYHVEYKPDEERTEVRKKLVKVHEATLGAFIFDGQALYTPHRLIKNPLLLYSMNTYTNQKVQISIRLVSEITPVDTVFLQVYNIIFRNIMTSMELEPMGRFYYDPKSKTTIPSRKLEIWPGYITSVRNHENKLLLNLELTHKVVRSDTVLDFINNTKASMGEGMRGGRWDYKQESMKHLLGSIVLTRYNKKNYKVDDIKWDVNPIHEFKMRDGKSQSYKDYYKSQYGTIIKDVKQPMLVSLPKKKDYHRGSSQPIYLVPELCQMTGLNDSMRKDVNLMRDLSNHLVMCPEERVTRANAFIARLYADQNVRKELERWNIKIGRKPEKCLGRVVDLDELKVGGYMQGVVSKVKQDKPGDWTNLFKSKPMLSTVALRKWIMITCPKSEQVTHQLLAVLRSTARSMNFVIDHPMMTFVLRDTKPTTYASTIHQLWEQSGRKVQMFVTLLPNNNAEVYAAIKRKCYLELGVSSQCILVKTMMTKNPASVASRLAIQMNAKLGGEPWAVDIPLKDVMIIGYDVYHSGNKRSPSVGALVASTSSTLAKYFASTYFHTNRSELSANLCSQMTNALEAYKAVNGKPPARIFLYRDGVGDGQLSYIYNTELAQIQEAIRGVYGNDSSPKFAFIVVTKRIHTRIYGPPEPGIHSAEVNPPPGTVVDDVITRPERYDFYLVSQVVNNVSATVSPTSYNVLHDSQGLDVDKIQRLTLKLCHLYYNYTGTIAVPAPCQFAHKLAYLTGMSLSTTTPTKGTLQNLLYFL